MASKRRIRRKACTGKARHKDIGGALIAKGKLPWGKELTAYKCQFCKGYHLGHPTRKMRQAIKAKQESR